jgi:hypothetical protein
MEYRMKTFYRITLPAFLLLMVLSQSFKMARPDEGMFPMSEISKLDLKKAGLRMNQEDIFNPEGISLTDALVRVGGCTGSFVSNEGLMITNHHCAFGSVQAASSPANDYITHGFLAKRREDEIVAKGLTCKITQSYQDVSDRVLASAQGIQDPAERLMKISETIRAIESEENQKYKGMACEISEMFTGKTYVLFRYQIIRDVRLVYVPQRDIGEFGGESDNWEWPRHTGDFSFLRAYVAPDGSPADYSAQNVPYKPKKHLIVNPDGVNEGDFVFILGYPGRTFRNMPARYIRYQERYQMPYIANLFEEQIATMKALGKNDKDLEIRVASRIKQLANVSKNYRGKLEGFKNLNLVNKKLDEDKMMANKIQEDDNLKALYANLMSDIDKLYDELDSVAIQSLWFNQIFSAGEVLSAANVLIETNEKMATAGTEEEKEKIAAAGKAKLRSLVTGMHNDVDVALISSMIRDARIFSPQQKVTAVEKYFKKDFTPEQREKKLRKWWADTKLSRPSELYAMVGTQPALMRKSKDPIIKFVYALRDQIQQLRVSALTRQGKLTQLLAAYVDAKSQIAGADFIPDANATLRLTFGNIKGYSLQDAVKFNPITTLSGMIQKGYDGGDYSLNPIIEQLFKTKNFGRYKMKDKEDVPLAILYNTDTSGGNSGSPIMDADGKLVGVNFDRAYPATINDFAWNDKYSRSIGVDIRFVLWVTEYVGNAGFLLEEMEVK